jgi:aspartyl-tRNA(Asn)/glutamyl-tRNA(Gln) amidotransferase subunit B
MIIATSRSPTFCRCTSRQRGSRRSGKHSPSASRPLADYFEATASEAKDGQAAANWIETEVLRKIKGSKLDVQDPKDIPLDPGRLGKLVRLVKDGTISGKTAKEVFEAIYDSGKDPADVVRDQGLAQVTDEKAIQEAIEAVIAKSAQQYTQYRAGKTALLGYFVGQVLKATGGTANPALVNRLLKERLDKP